MKAKSRRSSVEALIRTAIAKLILQAIEFETRLQDGVTHLPTPYRNWRNNRPVKVILLAADYEAQTAPLDTTQRLCAILEISRLCAAAPELDSRSADEIIGYAANGLPT